MTARRAVTTLAVTVVLVVAVGVQRQLESGSRRARSKERAQRRCPELEQHLHHRVDRRRGRWQPGGHLRQPDPAGRDDLADLAAQRVTRTGHQGTAEPVMPSAELR